MKLSFAILIVLFSCTRKKENKHLKMSHTELNPVEIKDSTDKKFILLNDTVFISRTKTNNIYHAIFIDTNKKSKYYDWLTNFEFNNYDSETYLSNYKYLKEKDSKNFQKINLTSLSEHWIPIYQYENNFYLYAPSDWGNMGKKIINDSAFIEWYMDGPYPSPLISAKKTSNNKHVLIINDLYNNNKLQKELTIFEIDKLTKLSVFKFTNNNGKPFYQLYAPKESARYFDIVVNYCEHQKTREFIFDEIDFDKLLKNN